MRITAFSPDPDKYADECGPCNGAGVIALNTYIDDYPFWRHHVESELCTECEGTGITVDWQTVERALLEGRQ